MNQRKDPSPAVLDKIRIVYRYDPDTGEIFIKKNNKLIIRSDKDGYTRIKIFCNGKIYYSMTHRIAWFLFYGVWPIEIDHIDRNKSNNRISNLRECTRSQNRMNTASWSPLGYKGVVYYKPTKQWQSKGNNHGTKIFLGYYDTAEDAARAYNIYVREYCPDFAFYNDVPDPFLAPQRNKHNKEKSAAKIKKIIEMYLAGFKYKDIIKECQCSKGWISIIINKNKLPKRKNNCGKI